MADDSPTTNESREEATEEQYAYDEPTPADEVVNTEDGPVILRMGEPPIPVGCGATCAEEIPESA